MKLLQICAMMVFRYSKVKTYKTDIYFINLKVIFPKQFQTHYVGTIGNIGIHNRPGKYHLGSNVGKIELYNEFECLLEEYVVAYLQSDIGYKQLTKHKKATAQESISIEAIRDVFIPIPPSAEQQRICTKMQVAFQYIDLIRKEDLEITSLISLVKSRIIDLAIRGKLVPQDSNDEACRPRRRRC